MKSSYKTMLQQFYGWNDAQIKENTKRAVYYLMPIRIILPPDGGFFIPNPVVNWLVSIDPAQLFGGWRFYVYEKGNYFSALWDVILNRGKEEDDG